MPLVVDDIDLLERLSIFEARESFWAYRRYMNPRMKLGWWQREIANELERFVRDLLDGLAPKLVIEAPPQHGKSQMVVDMITWLAGLKPELGLVYTSFSQRLGVRANLRCQRTYDSAKYQAVFPRTKINAKGVPTEDAQQATRNRELLEYIGQDGYFRNTTVRGSITGEGLDVGVVDDPLKGREAASSQTIRDMTWDWFTDDFFSRFSEEAGLLCILTRWHVDDPIGRLKKEFGDALRVVSYSAIATKNETYRKEGEALFPEHKSLAYLLERKRVMAAANWEALFQQNPQILGGDLIKGEWFPRYKVVPLLKYRIIYGDTAQKTKEANDYSVFECWGMGVDNRIYLLDLIRKKWTAPDLETAAIDFWNKHKAMDVTILGQLRKMKIEDKASGTGLVQCIKRKGFIPVEGIPRGIDKYTRILDGQGYMQSGYVCLPEQASWVFDFIDECEAVTANGSHEFDDQIDPMLDAINDMLGGNNITKLWENMT